MVIQNHFADSRTVLQDQFVEEVGSNSNEVIVLTPPNFNLDGYTKRLALCSHHQSIKTSAESIKTIWFFQHVVSSRGIAYLRSLPTICHPISRGLPEDLALRLGLI